MNPKNRKPRTLLGLFCLTLIMIGVMVWPPPKDALAQDIRFRARVDWNGNTRNDNGIRVSLRTRAEVDGLALDSREMTLVSSVEGVSYYEFSFTPDREARFWDVTLVNIRQHKWAPTLMPLRDGEEIIVGIISDLDAAFICIDQ